MQRTAHDYSKLLGLLKENGVSQADLVAHIGTTPTALSLKLNSKANFKLSEIKLICNFSKKT